MPTARQRLIAKVLRLYPFYSGCGTIGNHAWVRRISGHSNDLAWARVGGGRILCPLDDFVGRAVFYTGDLDRKVSWLCRRLVRPGDTVLDVGANIGLVTVLLSHLVGRTGHVHSFEPNPRVAELLERTLEANGRGNVNLHRFGLGAEEGTLSLHVPEGNAGAASLEARTFEGSTRTVRVPVERLSSVVEAHGIRSIQLLKIDVEGFEPEVLRGGEGVLRSVRPRAILFEMNDPGADPAEHATFRLLSDAGYGFFSIPKSLLRMRPRTFDPFAGGDAKSHDFLAVPRGEPYEETARIILASNQPSNR